MKRIILVYGAISGAIVITTMTIGLHFGGPEGASASQVVGYLIMLVALSAIFVGIKKHRDQDLGGVINFGSAFLLGLGISAVAGAMYVVGWEMYLFATDHAFIEKWSAAAIKAKEAAGLSGPELEAFKAKMASMVENYANPLFRLPMTFMEIFPVGLLVSLVSALILRKSDVLPAGGPASAATPGV